MTELAEVKEYSLSDADIRKMLGSNISIMTYPELKFIKNIDDCFDDKGRCILLFLTENEHSGHWTALLKSQAGILFFDPYGEAPDAQKKGIPASQLQALDETQPYLTNLLRASGHKVTYSHIKFQKDKVGINTCGRWCIARCLFANKSDAEFKNMITKSGLSNDDFVAALVADKLGK